MGKAIGGLPEPSALTGSEPGTGEEAAAGGPERIGAYLGRQRRLRGISLDELEALTRIPRRSLERLEAGAFDRDPDGFARGFVRTVSGAIGLDPDDSVARMLAEPEAGRAARGPLAGRLVPVLALLAVGAALLLLAGRLLPGGETPARGLAPPALAPSAPLVRRDAVRDLAISVGEVPGEPLASTGADD